MAQVEEVVLVCDLCGSEEEVLRHTVEIDGERVEIEVCDAEWSAIAERLAAVIAEGRSAKRRRRTRQSPRRSTR